MGAGLFCHGKRVSTDRTTAEFMGIDSQQAEVQNHNLSYGEKGVYRMKSKLLVIGCTLSLVLTLRITPALAAQEPGSSEPDGVAIAGSVVLSLLHLPLKLVTCVGTQALGAVAYAATYGVPGNYEGDTNGKQIGEVARGACGGSWIISPEQVKKDY